MRFKLDENLGTRTRKVFVSKGHDAQTVHDESMTGFSDQAIFEACRTENRCLITLDTDFADVTRFSPDESSGIAVFRIPQNPSLDLLERMAVQFLDLLQELPIDGTLWIVEAGRIRIHENN